MFKMVTRGRLSIHLHKASKLSKEWGEGQSALLASATNVIFVHAHPSGDPDPSYADREITKILKKAGELLQISVLDHIIIGLNRFYSFADRGEL